MLCVAKCVENIAHEKQFIRLNLREEDRELEKGSFLYRLEKASQNDERKRNDLEMFKVKIAFLDLQPSENPDDLKFGKRKFSAKKEIVKVKMT